MIGDGYKILMPASCIEATDCRSFIYRDLVCQLPSYSNNFPCKNLYSAWSILI